MVLIANGTLLMIQNMTWNGVQGFTSKPCDPFYVPYHVDPSLSTLAAAGVMGTTHTERGLTFVYVDLSGHSQYFQFLSLNFSDAPSVIPQYQPSASYRTLEFLLGRIDSLSSTVPFSTQPDVAQSSSASGNGTAPPIKM